MDYTYYIRKKSNTYAGFYNKIKYKYRRKSFINYDTIQKEQSYYDFLGNRFLGTIFTFEMNHLTYSCFPSNIVIGELF